MSITTTAASTVVNTKDVLVTNPGGKNLACVACRLAAGHNSTFRADKLDQHLREHAARGHKVAA